MKIEIEDEGDRQILLLAIAELALRRPGWNSTLGRLAEIMGGRELFESFKKTNADLISAYLVDAGIQAAAERVAKKHNIALRHEAAVARNLFIDGEFQAHSGARLPFKIDCDALSDADIATLAAEIGRRFKFGSVHGVPRGGVRLANALIVHIDPSVNRLLIVDDVLTTGRSMEEAKAQLGGDPIGVVIFARGPCESWITPLFATPRPDPSDAEVEAAAWAHTPIVFIDTTGWDERSATYQATLKADALKHMRSALIAAARVRRNEGRRH